MSEVPTVHHHTWTVVEATRRHTEATSDYASLEACSACPSWRAVVRFDPGRDRADVEAALESCLAELARRRVPFEVKIRESP